MGGPASGLQQTAPGSYMGSGMQQTPMPGGMQQQLPASTPQPAASATGAGTTSASSHAEAMKNVMDSLNFSMGGGGSSSQAPNLGASPPSPKNAAQTAATDASSSLTNIDAFAGFGRSQPTTASSTAPASQQLGSGSIPSASASAAMGMGGQGPMGMGMPLGAGMQQPQVGQQPMLQQMQQMPQQSMPQ